MTQDNHDQDIHDDEDRAEQAVPRTPVEMCHALSRAFNIPASQIERGFPAAHHEHLRAHFNALQERASLRHNAAVTGGWAAAFIAFGAVSVPLHSPVGLLAGATIGTICAARAFERAGRAVWRGRRDKALLAADMKAFTPRP